jgi:FkbH-like protein
VLLDASALMPAEWSAADSSGLASYVEERAAEMAGLIRALAGRSTATVVTHTVPPPAEVMDTVISLRGRAALARAWALANAALLGTDQAVTLDLAGALANVPVQARDARLHKYADMPYTDGALLVLADQVRRVAQARVGLSKKVLAVDLDNTLWGGVVGEVGAGGVELGGLYPGNCYLDVQRTVHRLREQGVILVLASKNDPEVAEEALRTHPEVVLRPEQFSVRAVNWKPKPDNLRAAAESLGLGIDSFVFLDDSDFERGHVAAELPEVAVLPGFKDPSIITALVLAPGYFDVLTLTDTDRKRPDLYRTRALRSDFSSGFSSTEEYLGALSLSVEMGLANEFTIGRIAQLAARTNQFNLTGIRFDAATTAQMSSSDDHLVASVSVSDRFGDEGLAGAMWVERGPVWRVLNMVLSCRVFNRGIETAALSWLARRALAAGAAALDGRFVPSAKNGVASAFWTSAGFVAAGSDGSDGSVFRYDLSGPELTTPKWIALRERGGDCE